MPKVYFGDRSIVSLGTATAVHELPFGQRIVSGVTPPAAGAGSKQLSGKARMRIESMTAFGRDYRLQATPAIKITALCDLHLAYNPLDGILRTKWTTPRCELTAGAGGADIAAGAVGTAVIANNAAVTANAPTRAVDDLLICLATSRSGAGTISPSTGWTNEGHEYGGGTYMPTKFYWRWATNTSADNITVTPSGGSNGDTVIARIYVYQNVKKTGGPFVGQLINSISSNIANYTDSTNNESIGDATQFLRGVPMYYTSDSWALEVPAKSHILFGIQEDNDATAVTGMVVQSDSRSTTEERAFTFTTDGWTATTTGNDATQYMFRAPNPSTAVANFNVLAQITRAIATAGSSNHPTVAAVLLSNTVAPNVDVWLPGRGDCKWSATATLFSGTPRLLDGSLGNKVTLTGDLTRVAGAYLDGILNNHVSLLGTLTSVTGPGVLDGILRMRTVGNVAVLKVGTHHMTGGALPVKWSASAILTLNYMRCLMIVPWRVTCDLDVHIKLAGSAGLKQTPTVALTRGPGTGGGFTALHWTGTARLTMPLQGAAATRFIALAIADVQRRIAGSTTLPINAPSTLSVVRMFGASAGARQAATATLTAPRLFAGQARLRSAASASLTSDRHLGGTASILWRAYLAMQPVGPVRPPTTDITVSPYTPPVDSETLPVEVESPSGTVHVEEE